MTNSAEDFSTPSVPSNWPVVELERTGTVWRVSSNAQNACAISVGRTYVSLGAAEKAFEVCGSIVLNPITSGEYTEPEIAMHGRSMAWVGPVDAKGVPTITLVPQASSTTAFHVGGNDPQAVYFAKNFIVGPHQALIEPGSTVAPTCAPASAIGPKYRTGGAAVRFDYAGRLNVINLRMRNGCGNGISSGASQEWQQKRGGQIWVYDSEIYGYGTQDNEHNIYVHDLNVFAFIRSISSDTSGGGHLVKVDGEKVIVLDSALVRNTRAGYPSPDNTSALLNVTRTDDIRVARTLFKYNPVGNQNGGSIVQTVSRIDALGGFSVKTPPVADIENKPGLLRDMTWESGGSAATYWTTRVEADVSAGATTLLVGRVNADGNPGGKRRVLSTSTPYTVRVRLDDSTIQEFTSTPSVISPTSVSFPVPGTGMTKAAARNNYVAIKEAAQDWDRPVLNPRYGNRNSPDYWWTSIKDATGQLDLNHQERFNTHYFEDDFVVYDNLRGNVNLFSVVPGAARMFWVQSPAPVPELPLPPFNRPQGPTKDWPDHPGYAEWKEPLQGPGYPYRGRNPAGVVSATNLGSVTDFVWPWPMFIADIGVVSLEKPLDRQVSNSGAPKLPESLGFTPDVRYVNAAGALTQVTSPNPLPAQGKAILVGAHAAGARTLIVDSVSGCSEGQKIMVELPLMAGAAKSMEITTIDQPISGASIHIAEGLSREAEAGANVVCFTKAATRPSTWIGPNDYASR